MHSLLELIPLPVQAAVARVLFGLPERAQRALAGPPVRVDGQQLDTEAHLLLRLSAHRAIGGTVARGRQRLRRTTRLVGGPPIGQVHSQDVTIPSPAGAVPARLYRPAGLPAPSQLLVYYHGGGWVEGDLDTHDNVCRFLGKHAGLAVLAVHYRRAPEHPFPAAVNDALVAFRYAVASAGELAVDPAAIAVGGDSAGGNLAAAVGLLAGADPVPPAFLLMIYPATDATVRRPSRQLFGSDFLLTEERIDFFLGHYVPDRADYPDPRVSPLLASLDELGRLPPAYLATAGFDPLRDEGELFAARLAEAGVPVALRRFAGQFHGFANVLAFGRSGREAMHEIASALRTGLALRPDR